jgi:uncharacterized RDD family membrane protein YckC/RNA polymerase subunit RPABC4/transcription elongation factor Spt4
VQCSNCNKDIADGSRFCGFCGAEQKATKKCASCGHEIEGQPNFCPYCGSSITGQPAQAVQASQSVPPMPAPNYQQPGYAASGEIPKEATVGVGWRFAATIIDGILLFIIGYLMAIITGQTSEGGFNLQGASAFLWFLIGIAYYIVMEAMLGATVGKMACGLKVLKTDGSPMDWNASVVRNILRIVDAFPFAYLLGIILVWTSPMRQRLGDRVAHTVVVKKSRL